MAEGGRGNCYSVGIESPVGKITQRNGEIYYHQSWCNIELFQKQHIIDAK